MKSIEVKRTGKEHLLAERARMIREKEKLEKQQLATTSKQNNLAKEYDRLPTADKSYPTAPSVYYSTQKEALNVS